MYIEIIFKDEEGNVLATNGKAHFDESVNYDEKVYELSQEAEAVIARNKKANEFDADYQAQIDTGYDDTSADE